MAGNQDNIHTTMLVRTEGGEARTVRALAGAPAGVVRTRRGSFLVLVVGVLALLAVVAILYASIGIGDRQRVAATARKDAVDEIPANIRDYIADVVIGPDVLDTYWDRAAANLKYPDQIASKGRESWDYPSSNYNARSRRANGGLPVGTVRFNPTGAAYADGQLNLPTTHFASDPWLASFEPTYLDWAEEGVLEGERPYLNKRDWAQISIIAPDGHFVNLINLRGNYNCPPDQMMDGPNGSVSLLRRSGTVAPEAASLNAARVLDFTGNAQFDTPAHWGSRQVGMFQPAIDRVNNGTSPNYLLYQYADADGDGYIDSRWTELVDVFDPANPPVYAIPQPEGMRVFVAVRIIDASGLVNVNTAGDLKAGPDERRGIGSTPAEIDLRRALMMSDAYENYLSPSGTNVAQGFNDLFRADEFPRDPRGQNLPIRDTYTQDNARFIGHRAYQAIRLALAAGTGIPTANTSSSDFIFRGDFLAPSTQIGGSFTEQYSLTGGRAQRLWDFQTTNLQGGANEIIPTPSEARGDHYDRVLNSVRGAYFGAAANNNTPLPVSFTGPFGFDDLVELQGRHGLDDPNAMSALEATVDGRTGTVDGTESGSMMERSANLPAGGTALLSPFLNLNYPVSLLNPTQRDGRGAFDPQAIRSDLLYRDINPRAIMTTVNGAREIRAGWGTKALTANDTTTFATDTLNLAYYPENGWSSSELRLNVQDILNLMVDTRQGVNQGLDSSLTPRLLNVLLDAYADVLLPFAGENRAWSGDAAVQTLAYGYHGPELALHTAAHMALNLKDTFDKDGTPSVATLIVDNGSRDALNNQATQPLLTRADRPFPFWRDAQNNPIGLDLNYEEAIANVTTFPHNRLADENNGDAFTAPAVNVFGVEAQPFITAACSFAVYTDTPSTGSRPRPGDDEGVEFITIDARVEKNNPDFLFRVVAFQLTNPFDKDIELCKDPNFESAKLTEPTRTSANLQYFDVGDQDYFALDRLKELSYIKFGGRTFPLVQMREERNLQDQSLADQAEASGAPHKFEGDPTGGYYTTLNGDGVDVRIEPIKIPAGKSIVVYSISGIPRQILQQRYKNAETVPPGGASPIIDAYLKPGTIESLIKGHIFKDVASSASAMQPNACYWIPEMDPATGKPCMTTDGSATPEFYDNQGLQGQAGQLGIFGDVINRSQGSRPPENNVIELWRALRTGPTTGGTVTEDGSLNIDRDDSTKEQVRLPSSFWDGRTSATLSVADLYSRNNEANDMLVDRFRLPPEDAGNFDVRLRTSGSSTTTQIKVDGAFAHDPDDATRVLEDTGYTLSIWASAKRPVDPRADATPTIPLGAIPSYCLERKDATTAWNEGQEDDIRADGLDMDEDFDSGPRYAQETLERWRDAVDNDAIIVDVSTAAANQNTGRIAGKPVSPWLLSAASGWTRPRYEQQYPEAALANNWFHTGDQNGNVGNVPTGKENMRLIDVLRPLAIGPMQDPTYALNNPVPPTFWPLATASDVEWTTLSEMLALTLGYETRPIPPAGALAAISLYYPEAPASIVPSNTSPRPFDRGRLVLDDYVPFFDANEDGILNHDAAQPEYPRGAGIPLALNAFDVFTTRPISRDHATPGVVNVNTAPLRVLRLIPGLTPTDQTFDPLAATTAAATPWIGAGGRDAIMGDSAAMLQAFRDKTAPMFRAAFTPLPLQEFGNFRDNLGANGANPDDYGELDVREGFTGIAGFTERPGLPTLGAVLAARWRAGTAAQVDQLSGVPGNMDSLGFNPVVTTWEDSQLGVASAIYKKLPTSGSGSPTTLVANEIPNDYDEKLAIAAGAMGTSTNRSDVFICWFLVHGYTEQDVAIRAGDTSPMTPSMARRFMMVVDRSNVQKKGDKPRVLMFKEVPL